MSYPIPHKQSKLNTYKKLSDPWLQWASSHWTMNNSPAEAFKLCDNLCLRGKFQQNMLFLNQTKQINATVTINLIPMRDFGAWRWSCHFVLGTGGSRRTEGTGDRTAAPVVSGWAVLCLYSTSNLNRTF